MAYTQAEGLLEITRRMGRETGLARSVLEGVSASDGRSTAIYLFSIKEIPNYYKIGISKEVHRRLADYNTAMPFTVVLEYSVEHPDFRSVEKALHKRFKHKRIKGEWFLLSDFEIAELKQILTPVLNYENKPQLSDKT
jgi:hypothetical protein